MGAPCGLSSHGKYAAKHDPFVYFADVSGWDGTTFQPSPRCDEHVVDYSQLDRDLATTGLPSYSFITPNLDHDMHDGTIAQGDRWLPARCRSSWRPCVQQRRCHLPVVGRRRRLAARG